jgi:hypothetical protein
MPYTGVERVVTIFIDKSPAGKYIVKDVTPDRLHVLPKDTVVWHVQGAPRTVKVGVSFNHPSAHKHFTPRTRLHTHATRRKLRADVPHMGDGRHKYSIFIDGKLAKDPDIEVRGGRP